MAGKCASPKRAIKSNSKGNAFESSTKSYIGRRPYRIDEQRISIRRKHKQSILDCVARRIRFDLRRD